MKVIRAGSPVQLRNNHRRKAHVKVVRIFHNGRLALLSGKLGRLTVRNLCDLERAGEPALTGGQRRGRLDG